MTRETEEAVDSSLRTSRRRLKGRTIRTWIPRLASAMFIATGILSLRYIVDVLPMILAGAVDIRHFAWVALGGSSSFLAFVLAWRAYQLGEHPAEGSLFSVGHSA